MMTRGLPKEPYEMHAELSTLGNRRGKPFSTGFWASLTMGSSSEAGSLSQPGCTCLSAKYLAPTALWERSRAREPKGHERGGGQVTPVQSWSLPVWSWCCIRDGSKRSVLEAGKWLLKGKNVYPKTPLSPFAVCSLWSWRREDSSPWPSKKHRWWVLQSQMINSYLQPHLPAPWIPSSVWHLYLINRELISSPSFVEPSQLDVRTNVSVLARTLKPES